MLYIRYQAVTSDELGCICVCAQGLPVLVPFFVSR